MTLLYQKSIADIAAQPLTRDQEMYEPTESEREQGMWAVVADKVDEDGDPEPGSRYHIIPTHGVNHQISEMCWCEPTRHEHSNGQPYSVVHSISQ